MTDGAPSPSETGYEQCEPERPSTLCDLDVRNNVWVEGVVDVAKGQRGICMLDTLSRAQVMNILERVPRAREDLPKVTSDPELLQLLESTRLLPRQDLHEQLQSKANRNPAGLPYYTVFRGRAPTARR